MAKSARPPIVAVMGHIDHGKSSLLDYIRKANVTAGEAGGITQHVSAYEAEHVYEGETRRITFLDTPGHEAFRALRARGAAAADVAILVIAAEEGIKPQTLEAFEAITEAGTPFVVAFTKIDKPGADVEKAKISALENGIYLEGLGGSIAFAGVSSKSGEGIPELLDLVLLTTDLAELTADPSEQAEGYILESSQDPKRGLSASLIIKNGTLKTGSFVVAGAAMAPVRFIEDFAGKRISEALPSQPVSVSGWSALPPAGTPFYSTDTKREAEKFVAEGTPKPTHTNNERTEAGVVSLPIILKADATGSILAIKHELAKIAHERVAIRIVLEGVGAVSENDVKAAAAGGGHIIGFNVRTDGVAADAADRMNVKIDTFSIIYDLKERVEELVKARAPRVTIEEVLGEAKVLKAFNTSGTKQVLGARWNSGALSVGNTVKIDRRGLLIGTAKLTNLQMARADVSSVHTEGEFGLQIEGKYEAAPGDTLIAYKMTETT